MYHFCMPPITIYIVILILCHIAHSCVFLIEIIKKQGDEGIPDLVHVMRTLASESIPNLPPGGELASK